MGAGGRQLDVSGRLGTSGSVETPPVLSGKGGEIGTSEARGIASAETEAQFAALL